MARLEGGSDRQGSAGSSTRPEKADGAAVAGGFLAGGGGGEKEV